MDGTSKTSGQIKSESGNQTSLGTFSPMWAEKVFFYQKKLMYGLKMAKDGLKNSVFGPNISFVGYNHLQLFSPADTIEK